MRFIPACAGNACSGRFPRFPPAVHPRMRGERRKINRHSGVAAGSSPHARGTRVGERVGNRNPRFIPACAGNARRVSAAFRPTSVHPRMRGERNPKDIGVMLQDGSSPHARGTRNIDTPRVTCSRFIPACAGNAKTSPTTSRVPPVHPRMRGERRVRCPLTKYYAGSSPHARGTLLGGGWHRLCSTVHPRMRGERLFQAVSIVSGGGSSPHARGTLRHSSQTIQRGRFIPACAGNARPGATPPGSVAVHPRMRGERRRARKTRTR